MRGSPFRQMIVMVIIVILAGVPVYRLTHPALAEPPSARVSATASDLSATPSEPLEVEVTFAPAATDFQLKNLDQVVLAGRGPQTRFHTRWTATVPSEGVDLVILAHWPSLATATASTDSVGADPAAARVTLRFGDGRQVEKSFWAAANGTLTEVFTVPGESSAAVP